MSNNVPRFSANGASNSKLASQGISSVERQRMANSALVPVLEQITTKFNEIEKNLKAKGFKPIEAAWATYMTEGDPELGEHPYSYYVGMASHKGEWRLCHSGGYDEVNEELSSFGPVVESDRSKRICIAQRVDSWLPLLQKRIAEQTEAFGQKANEGLRLLQAALEKM